VNKRLKLLGSGQRRKYRDQWSKTYSRTKETNLMVTNR